ncbi:hypothetical protein BGLA2_700004 [Burkholderia gladioli]|nr:hypothetical protein BGLA2_700004 [Burkholderia gladioli]
MLEMGCPVLLDIPGPHAVPIPQPSGHLNMSARLPTLDLTTVRAAMRKLAEHTIAFAGELHHDRLA